MKITIEPVNNGAVVTHTFDDGEEKNVFVFEDDKLDDLQSMLYDLSSTLHSDGRYCKERIQIKIVHGDKYECKDKECPICKEE